MIIINYKDKKINNMNANGIKAEVISYEIEEQDMNLLAKLSGDEKEYEIRRFILYKDWGSFEMVVDNIQDGRIIQGGLVEGRYILNQYLVSEGLNNLLLLLSLNDC